MSENYLENLKSLLNSNSYKEISDYVIDAFDKYHSIDNLEYSFQMKKGTMHSDAINTTLKFDPEANNVLSTISNELYREDVELNEEIGQLVNDFLQGLRDYFNNNCVEQIRSKIRKYILKDANEEIFPLRTVRVENIEINDNSDDATITIKKNIPHIKSGNKTVPKPGYEGANLSIELFKIHEETGKDFNTIIAEKQAIGDPKYQYVTGVVVGKRMKYRFHLDLFVDYSADKDIAEKYQEVLKK